MLQQGCERPISPKSGIFFGITSRLSITSVLPPHPTHPDSLIRFRSLDRVRLLECRFSRGRVVSFGITHAALPSGRSWHEKPASGARHPPRCRSRCRSPPAGRGQPADPRGRGQPATSSKGQIDPCLPRRSTRARATCQPMSGRRCRWGGFTTGRRRRRAETGKAKNQKLKLSL